MVAHEHLHARFVYVRAAQSTAVMPGLGAVPIPGQPLHFRCCCTHGTTVKLLELQVTWLAAGLTVYHSGKLSGAAPLHVFGDAMSVQEDQARAAANNFPVCCYTIHVL